MGQLALGEVGVCVCVCGARVCATNPHTQGAAAFVGVIIIIYCGQKEKFVVLFKTTEITVI